MLCKTSNQFHFFTTFSLHFTLYSITSHALFGILYHELTSQNQGNDVQLPATCWQSKSNRTFLQLQMEMVIIFFHARARLSCLVIPDRKALRYMIGTPLYGRKCRHAVTCRRHSLQSGTFGSVSGTLKPRGRGTRPGLQISAMIAATAAAATAGRGLSRF